MRNARLVELFRNKGRTIGRAQSGDEALGPLALLPGVWKNVGDLKGHGWNMIALPFATKTRPHINYRLLMNQYNEELRFTIVDKAVPNRGIARRGPVTVNTDQFLATIDYEQQIDQVAAADFPDSGLAGGSGLAIHHEPGLWLHITNENTDNLDIARLGTIPHGDSVLALGRSGQHEGPPAIPDENGLPIGVKHDLDSVYLSPYKHFQDNPFRGVFKPVQPNELLKRANAGVDIVRTTTLHIDTAFSTGGIVNIPFIVKQADASKMHATFWIQELAEKDEHGDPKLRLQYTQTVLLDFFPSEDSETGRIRWPHVSINTLEKVPPSDELHAMSTRFK